MLVKSGVMLSGVHPYLWYAAAVVDLVRLNNGLGEGMITGGREGADAFGPARVKGSLHPAGKALDFRTRDIAVQDIPAFVAALREALGPYFDVILEPDHINVELSRQGLLLA